MVYYYHYDISALFTMRTSSENSEMYHAAVFQSQDSRLEPHPLHHNML